MKKILVLVSVFILVFTINVFADANVKVVINDEYINFTDENNQVVNPEITNDRIMVPLRKIFEELGTTVKWDDNSKIITAIKGNKEIKLTIGSDIAYLIKNGKTKIYTLDSVPYIKDGRTLVPLRFISESLGCLVDWDSGEKTAIIISLEDLVNEVLDECSNLKEFVTTTKASDKKYFDVSINGEFEIVLFDENTNLPIKVRIFNNDDGVYMNIIDLGGQESIKNSYYDLGDIVIKINEIKSVEDIVDLVTENKDLEVGIVIGEYTQVKNEYIKMFNNDVFTCKINGNKKLYSYDLSKFNKESSVSEDESLGKIENTDIDIDLTINKENDVITKLNIVIIQIEAADKKLELNIDINIKYSDVAIKLPNGIEVTPITDLIKHN